MHSKLYRLRQKAVWGDYGDILIRGLPAVRDQNTGRLLLERAGPFAPPIILTIEACVGFVALVTQTFRDKLTKAEFGQLNFQPTEKKRIVDIPWHTWDRRARLPWYSNAGIQAEPPEESEPENYILRREHSEQAASQMEDIWEFIAPVVPCEIDCKFSKHFVRHWYITRPSGDHKGLFRAPDSHVLFVNQKARQWFEQEAGDWIDFEAVTVTN